jgi:hypothetical protein
MDAQVLPLVVVRFVRPVGEGVEVGIVGANECGHVANPNYCDPDIQ